MASGLKVEGSQLSRSAVSNGSHNRLQLIATARPSIVDAVFPLTDEMLKFTRLPPILYFILTIILCIEISCCSFWIQFPGYMDFSTRFGSILKPFFQFTFFADLSGLEMSITIRFVITTAFTVVYFGMLILQGLIYAQQRRFIRWTIYVTRFFIEFIPMICLFPLGNYIGETFQWMCQSLSALSIVYFALNMIYLACFIFAHYLE
jgi:hypothetical protein